MKIEFSLNISGGPAKLPQWLSVALHAALSGASLAMGAAVLDPATFNMAQLKHLGAAMGMGAVLGIVGLLRQNPFARTPATKS